MKMPVECEWAMRNSDLYKYEDEDGRSENEEYLIESLSLTSTTKQQTPLEPQTTRIFEPYPSSGPPSTIATTTTTQQQSTTSTIRPHKHRDFENDEYSLDYWQGVSEQPLMKALETTTPTWTTENPNHRTPFLANAFKDQQSLSFRSNCSILWLITSTFMIIYRFY